MTTTLLLLAYIEDDIMIRSWLTG